MLLFTSRGRYFPCYESTISGLFSETPVFPNALSSHGTGPARLYLMQHMCPATAFEDGEEENPLRLPLFWKHTVLTKYSTSYLIRCQPLDKVT